MIVAVAVAIGSASAAELTNAVPVISSAAAVRAVSASVVKTGLTVHLHGVVLFVDSAHHHLFLHDGSAGIFVAGRSTREGAQAGDTVGVRGVTWNGGFAPAVWANVIDAGARAPLPAPERATIARLTSGRLADQWVELEGVIRSVGRTRSRFEPRSNRPRSIDCVCTWRCAIRASESRPRSKGWCSTRSRRLTRGVDLVLMDMEMPHINGLAATSA